MCPKVSLCRNAKIKTSPLNMRKINRKKRIDSVTTPIYPTCNKKNICLFTDRGNHDNDDGDHDDDDDGGGSGSVFVLMIMIMALIS